MYKKILINACDSKSINVSEDIMSAAAAAATPAPANTEERSVVIPTPSEPLAEERCGSVREVGGAATWSLSSCKPGYGVQQLRDGCIETYWQSDGQLPHLVNVQFRSFDLKIFIQFILYLSGGRQQ